MSGASRLAPRLAALLLIAAGCATVPAPPPGTAPPPAMGPLEVHRALLGRNEGLGELRAVVEARFSFAGRQASFPGVLVLRRYGGFRLDLLDPLDRPIAIVYVEGRRLAQYRPAERLGSSLGVFPEGCEGLDPAEWAAALVADGPRLAEGDRARLRSLWGTKVLEITRDGELRQSVRYVAKEGELRPSLVSWYCAEEPVMQMKVRSWRADAKWRLPERFELSWPRSGLTVRVDVREVDAGPGPAPVPLVPRVDPETRWTVWNLPR